MIQSATISSYLTQIKDHHLLTAEEEMALATIVQGKHGKKRDAAIERLVTCNLKLGVRIAGNYQGLGCDLEDLISEANIGIQKAAERFKPNFGARFSTYAAWWIKQGIKRYLHNHSKTIRQPVHFGDKMGKLRRIKAQLAAQLGQDPTLDEIAEALGIEVAELEKTLQMDTKTVSIDTPLNDEHGDTLADIICDPGEQPDTVAQRHLEHHKLLTHMPALPVREQQVIIRRFGLDGGKPQTLEEVGAEFKITRERIRQLQNIALKKLRFRMDRGKEAFPPLIIPPRKETKKQDAPTPIDTWNSKSTDTTCPYEKTRKPEKPKSKSKAAPRKKRTPSKPTSKKKASPPPASKTKPASRKPPRKKSSPKKPSRPAASRKHSTRATKSSSSSRTAPKNATGAKASKSSRSKTKPPKSASAKKKSPSKASNKSSRIKQGRPDRRIRGFTPPAKPTCPTILTRRLKNR